MYEDFIKGTADMERRRDDDEAHFSQEVNRAATRRSATAGDDDADDADADAESRSERRPHDNGLDPTRAAFSEVSRWRRRRGARQMECSRRRQLYWCKIRRYPLLHVHNCASSPLPGQAWVPTTN